jgi:hypothetical protein
VKLYADTNGQMYISTAGAAWGPFGGGGAGAGGANTEIQYNRAGALAGDGDFTFTPEALPNAAIVNLWGNLRFDLANGRSWQMKSQAGSGGSSAQITNQTQQFAFTDETWGHTVLKLVPSSSQFSPSLVFVYTPGYFQSDNGFNANNATFNAFRATGGGGIHVSCVRASFYTHLGKGSAPNNNTVVGDTIENGCIYYDIYSNTLKAYIYGAWKTVYTF